MALIKHRPRLRVRCPALVLPGEEFSIRVEAVAKREVEIAGIDVRVIGKAWAGTEGGWLNIPGPSLLARVAGSVTLPAGPSHFEARATLPPDAAPTHSGMLIRCAYEVEVHVHIDRWPDRRERYALKVGTRPVPANVTTPLLVSTRPPVGGEPYLELALESPELLPGGTLAGAVALGNLESNRYESITFALVLRERVGNGPERSTQLHQWTLPVPSASDASVPFRLKVPADLVPTHSTPRYRVEWAFEAWAKVAWRSAVSMRLPIRVNARSAAAAPRPRLAVPIVGAERLAVLWSAVAQDAGLDVDEEGIHGTVGTVALRVRREQRGKRGTRVVAELRYPSLRLGLTVGPPRGLWGRIGADISMGEPKIDRRYQIEARSPGQARAMVSRLAGFLRDDAVELTLGDEQTRVEMIDAGYQRNRVDPLVRFARDLARALDARGAIPPPPELSATLGGWEALAGRLAGTLERGDGSIRGEHGGMPVSIEHEWVEPGVSPRATEIRLGIVPSLEADPDPERFDTEARSLLARIRDQPAHELTLGRDAMVVRIAPPPDPARVLSLLDLMGALARAMRPRVGPYR